MAIMKRMDKYIIKNFLKAVILCLISFLLLYLFTQLFKIVKFVNEGKMTSRESIFYTFTLMPKMITDVAPLAVLLGGLISMNSMASSLEIISLKTSGVSFKRIIRYPVIIAILISVLIFIFIDRVVPVANKYSQILRKDAKEEIIIPNTKNNAFFRDQENRVYYMQNINRINRTASIIEIVETNSNFNKLVKIIRAESGKFDDKEKRWIFSRVSVLDVETNENKFYQTFTSEKFNSEPEKFILQEKNNRNMTINELRKEIEEQRFVGGDVRGMIFQLSKKYSFPFASFSICFIGLALGSKFVRGGTAKNVGFAIVFGYGYYLLTGFFETFSKNGLINPFVSGWFANVLYICIGYYFLKRAEY
ncbi:MAG: LptF/LptG family permease [Fusobacteriaceae bacterium]